MFPNLQEQLLSYLFKANTKVRKSQDSLFTKNNERNDSFSHFGTANLKIYLKNE